ncbi:MAG: CU044_5270 family protein [Actinomycetota bacterium]|nr:CU044_5270 family protein [Actinomycetota bacterium]
MSDQFPIPEQFKAELQDLLLTHTQTTALGPRSQPPRPAMRRTPLRAGLALGLAAISAALVLALSSGGELRPQAATAASVLKASANALEHLAPSHVLGPHQYLYTRVAVWWRYGFFGPPAFVVRSVSEEWIARDGHGRTRTTVLSVIGNSHHHDDVTRSYDDRLQSSARPFSLFSVPGPGIRVAYAQLQRLPSNPQGLRQALDRVAASHPIARQFPGHQMQTVFRFGVLRALDEAPTSARLRAALYRVLASTPGIRLLGRRADSAGRTGTAVTASLGPVKLTLIIDPATGELLQTSRTLLHRSQLMPDQPAGLVNRATFLATGVVNSTRAHPR